MNRFEQTYQTLLSEEQGGWGGTFYGQRLLDWQRRLDEFSRSGDLPGPPAEILELGCGNGLAAYLLARKGYRVHGVDLSPTAVAWAEERFEAEGLIGHFRTADVASMPFYGDGSFGAVVDGNCLHYLVGADRARCLAEVDRVLVPGGIFVVSSMVAPLLSQSPSRSYDETTFILSESGYAPRCMPPESHLVEEIAKAGLTIIKTIGSKNSWRCHLWLLAKKGSDGTGTPPAEAVDSDDAVRKNHAR